MRVERGDGCPGKSSPRVLQPPLLTLWKCDDVRILDLDVFKDE